MAQVEATFKVVLDVNDDEATSLEAVGNAFLEYITSVKSIEPVEIQVLRLVLTDYA